MTTSISLDSTLSKIETIARTTWSDLESYAQPGKEDQFRSLRDGFISVLKSNKQLLLTLMVSQAKTISEITDATCRTKI